jgi:hypothetical protein
MNYRPYRYSPEQKDEIEREVSEMLKKWFHSPQLESICFTSVASEEKKMIHGGFVLIIKSLTV